MKLMQNANYYFSMKKITNLHMFGWYHCQIGADTIHTYRFETQMHTKHVYNIYLVTHLNIRDVWRKTYIVNCCVRVVWYIER